MDEAEQHSTTLLYGKALLSLAKEQRRWVNNNYTYNRWDSDRRLRWVKHIEREAAAGLPMAIEVVTRAVAIRMAG